MGVNVRRAAALLGIGYGLATTIVIVWLLADRHFAIAAPDIEPSKVQQIMQQENANAMWTTLQYEQELEILLGDPTPRLNVNYWTSKCGRYRFYRANNGFIRVQAQLPTRVR